MQIQVTTMGLDMAIAKINGIALRNPAAVMAVAAETIRRQTLQRFARKVDPDNDPWAPRKVSSIPRGRSARARHIRGGSGTLLLDTGRLRNSIASKVYGFTAEVGTNVFYGLYHQKGTRKMVARRFLGINEADAREIEQAISRYLEAGL
jgi:phage virion morphogenesis protein